MLGFTVTIFSEVALTSQNDADLRMFEEKVQTWPLVRECYMVTGGADFLLKIIAQDFDAYQHFLSTQLSTFSLVSQIKTRMVIRASKKKPGIPLELISV
jgi:DNA-binding Lrp family transcriptional regulator